MTKQTDARTDMLAREIEPWLREQLDKLGFSIGFFLLEKASIAGFVAPILLLFLFIFPPLASPASKPLPSL